MPRQRLPYLRRAMSCQPIGRAEKIDRLVSAERNIKRGGIQRVVSRSLVHKRLKVMENTVRQCDGRIRSQELRQPEHIVAVLRDVPAVDILARLHASGQVEECTGLERNEERLVDDRDAFELLSR